MMGRSHVVASVGVAVATAGACRAVLNSSAGALAPARELVSGVLSRYVLVSESPGWEAFWVLSGLMLFVFGSILPDVDRADSLVSRVLGFSIPIPHRRLTHSIWPCAALFCVGLRVRLVMFVLAGVLVHVLLDKPSAAGVCFLWPLTRYDVYPNGAFVARGHRLKLYRTGEGSEAVFVVLVLILSALVAWLGFRDVLEAVVGLIPWSS